MRKPLAAVCALAAAVALAACGSKKDVTTTGGGTQRVRLVLDYLPNPDHAGIYTAISEGDFRRAGLRPCARVVRLRTVPGGGRLAAGAAGVAPDSDGTG